MLNKNRGKSHSSLSLHCYLKLQQAMDITNVTIFHTSNIVTEKRFHIADKKLAKDRTVKCLKKYLKVKMFVFSMLGIEKKGFIW